MTLAAWLLLIVVPIAKQIFVGLGIGFMTYTGVDLLLNAAVGNVRAGFLGLSPDVAVFIQMSGVLDAIGIILGGVSARLLLMSMTRFKLTPGAI